MYENLLKFFSTQKNVNTLRKTLRELQAEFDYQRECKKDLEDLKEGLLTELTFLR